MEIEIATVFFGDRYAKLIPRTLLPSLYLPSNIPALLAAGHAVNHIFYCPPENVFDPGPLQTTVSFNTDIVKQNHESLGAAYQDCIQRGNLVVVAPADHVFGNGLADTISRMTPGDYMVCTHPRIREQAADQVERFFQKPIANHEFVNFCMERVPHSMVNRGIRGDARQQWKAVRKGRYWSVTYPDPPPLAFWGQPWMLKAWDIEPNWVGILGVIDHQLTDQALWFGHLLTVQDSRKFFWAELTDERREILPVPGGSKTNAMQYLDSLPVHWWTEPTDADAACGSCAGSPISQ